MSKCMTFPEVVFKDRDLLIAAFEEIGCGYTRQGADLEMGRYYSDQLEQKVEIVIPRGAVGNSFGDIGFAWTESGEYRPVMDDLDRSRALDGRFIPKLRAAYNERVVTKVAAKLRGTIHRSVEGGVVKIKVRY
ncbi:MAG TPA: DUF1257 domain-containing protein [Blastocatellia bacterium]|nr:DUF1257 domain-containing protein [Blastocatellia bacterium]